MLKKITLLSWLTLFLFTSKVQPIDGKTVATVAGVGAAVGTCFYWMQRESNSVKINRVNVLSTRYKTEIVAVLGEINALQDIMFFHQRSLEFLAIINKFDQQINDSYQEISKRYDSWCAPWNYTASMQRAYQTICDLHEQWICDSNLARIKITHMRNCFQTVAMIQALRPIMLGFTGFENEADIAKFARKLCCGSSVYPVKTSIEILQTFLNLYYKTCRYVICEQFILDRSELICAEMLSSQVYLEELKLIKEAERAAQELALQQRLVCAEEKKAQAEKEKAWAQQQQAYAQANQARAQEKQAEAERERNRIEREKLYKK
jgi:hypothetical protein